MKWKFSEIVKTEVRTKEHQRVKIDFFVLFEFVGTMNGGQGSMVTMKNGWIEAMKALFFPPKFQVPPNDDRVEQSTNEFCRANLKSQVSNALNGDFVVVKSQKKSTHIHTKQTTTDINTVKKKRRIAAQSSRTNGFNVTFSNYSLTQWIPK